MVEKRFPVIYTCRRCGSEFTVLQGDPEPDEDISWCWTCVDLIPGENARKWS